MGKFRLPWVTTKPLLSQSEDTNAFKSCILFRHPDSMHYGTTVGATEVRSAKQGCDVMHCS